MVILPYIAIVKFSSILDKNNNKTMLNLPILRFSIFMILKCPFFYEMGIVENEFIFILTYLVGKISDKSMSVPQCFMKF